MRAVTTGGAAAAALALTAGLGLAACSSSSSSSSSAPASTSARAPTASASTGASATASATAAAATSCGTIPTTLPSDPDGVIAALPSSLQDAVQRLPDRRLQERVRELEAQVDAATRPSASCCRRPTTATSSRSRRSWKACSRAPATQSTQVTSSDEVTDQVADFNQMVEKKVALIVYEPLSSTAFTTAVASAAAAGHPVDLGAQLGRQRRHDLGRRQRLAAGRADGRPGRDRHRRQQRQRRPQGADHAGRGAHVTGLRLPPEAEPETLGRRRVRRPGRLRRSGARRARRPRARGPPAGRGGLAAVGLAAPDVDADRAGAAVPARGREHTGIAAAAGGDQPGGGGAVLHLAPAAGQHPGPPFPVQRVRRAVVRRDLPAAVRVAAGVRAAPDAAPGGVRAAAAAEGAAAT